MKILLCFFLSLLVGHGSASTDSRGTTFVLAFMDTHVPANNGLPGDGKIIITSASANTRATISTSGFTTQISVSSGDSAVVSISHIYRQVANTVENKGFRITVAASVSVYAVSQGDYSSDSTVVFPTNQLKKEYIVASFQPYYYNAYISVVAPNAGTTTVKFYKPDFTNVYTLHTTISLTQDQSYLFSSSTDDLTGWKVEGSQNVAVFSGHSLTEVPVVDPSINASSTALDNYVLQGSHLWEMMPPLDIWGTEYVLPPAPARNKSTTPQIYIRVIGQMATTVTRRVTNTTFSIAQAGEYIDFNTTAGEWEYMECDNECMVAYYFTDLSYDVSQHNDPCLTILPSVKYYSTEYYLGTLDQNTAASNWVNYLTLAAETKDISKITVTALGVSYTPMWYDINGTDYSVAQLDYVNTSAANPTIVVKSSGSKFMALMTGVQYSDSYTYIGGWYYTPPGKAAFLTAAPLLTSLAVLLAHMLQFVGLPVL